MNQNQLVEDLSRNKTWESAEGRLIDLLTDVSSGVNNYERRHDGFVVNLDGYLKPILIPYRPGGRPQESPRPQEPPPAAQDEPGGALDGFQESEAQDEPKPHHQDPKRPKVITVPRPVPKSSPNEMMMSLAGLMIRYDKHARECIAFAMGLRKEDDPEVEEMLGRWMEYLKTRLPQ